MSKTVRLRKGLNIRLKGEAEKTIAPNVEIKEFALKPTDFIGVSHRLLVQPGVKVKAGTPLTLDKSNENVLFTSPVSGEILDVVRGPKRLLLEVKIKADDVIQYEDFGVANPNDLSREQIVEKLLKSGLWPTIRQRPYHVIANPDETPKSIFISGFDTAPLAPDYAFIHNGQKKYLQTGVDALKKLTSGKIHLNLPAKSENNVLGELEGVQLNKFNGPHPAGNVGIQIHHIDPINRNEAVWYVNPQHIVMIGKLFSEGKYDASKIIALTGSEVKNPQYYKIIQGASIEKLVKNNLLSDHVRYISGNVLAGDKIEEQGFNGFYDSQITVIPEGDKYEFFGWALPGLKKYSTSRTFFSWLTPNKKYNLNTNLHGGKRAFVMTGEYERVLPMDILPVHLLKAIMVEDIELMESLGIYEVAEEDFALCEFVCTSKTDVQAILRKGLDFLRKEMTA